MTGILKILSDTSIRLRLLRLAQRIPRLQNSSAENAKRSQLIIATTSGVGWILESDILGIAAMNCNDGSVKDFVGYKNPTYACYINGNTIEKNDISSNFQFVAWAMPAKI